MRIRESEVPKRGAQQSTWGATWTEKGVSSERPLLTSLPGTRVSGGLTLKIKSLYIWNLITAKYTGDVYMYRIHALGYEVEHKGNKWWCSSVIGTKCNMRLSGVYVENVCVFRITEEILLIIHGVCSFYKILNVLLCIK